jgi:hypothetical protein
MEKPIWRKLVFFIGWFFSNAVGIIIGAGFLFFAAYIMSGGFGAPVEHPAPVNYLSLSISSCLVGMIFGFILGLFQLIVLANQIKDAFAWLSATSVGAGLGITAFILTSFLGSSIPVIPDIQITFPFVLMGVFQWMVLKKQISGIKSSIWILVNFLNGLGTGLASIYGIIGMALYWIIGNIISGVTLVWLFDNLKTNLETENEK